MSAERMTCVRNDGYPASPGVNKVYESLPDDAAEEHGLLRIVDESGEDTSTPGRTSTRQDQHSSPTWPQNLERDGPAPPARTPARGHPAECKPHPQHAGITAVEIPLPARTYPAGIFTLAPPTATSGIARKASTPGGLPPSNR